MRSILVLTFFFFFIAAGIRAQNTLPGKFPSVTIKGSEIRTLTSRETGRTYDLYIQFSGARQKDKKYPVLYVLDGQWDFKLMDSVVGGLHYDRFVPNMMIVGITYSGNDLNYDALRAMDLTPVAEKQLPGSGDAPKFLTFLKKDVIPFVEKNYAADPSNRILQGSSLGGLFTLYTMFSEPSLFSAYIAASPAVTYGDKYLLTQEAKFYESKKDLPTRLFISVGSIENLTQPVKDFSEMIRRRSYSGLRLETRVLEGERHAGNKPEAFNRGLRFVFEN